MKSFFTATFSALVLFAAYAQDMRGGGGPLVAQQRQAAPPGVSPAPLSTPHPVPGLPQAGQLPQPMVNPPTISPAPAPPPLSTPNPVPGLPQAGQLPQPMVNPPTVSPAPAPAPLSTPNPVPGVPQAGQLPQPMVNPPNVPPAPPLSTPDPVVPALPPSGVLPQPIVNPATVDRPITDPRLGGRISETAPVPHPPVRRRGSERFRDDLAGCDKLQDDSRATCRTELFAARAQGLYRD